MSASGTYFFCRVAIRLRTQTYASLALRWVLRRDGTLESDLCSEVLILCDRRIDLIAPRQDSARKIEEIRKVKVFFKFSNYCAASATASAIDDYRDIPSDLIGFLKDLAHRDQVTAN